MLVFILLVLGLVAGSFVNALVWRIHEQKSGKKRSAKAQPSLSITRGRSMCPHCRHRLAWNDLIPVFSWLSLRGKCRYCHKPIPDSPIVEIAAASAFVVSYIYWPLAWNTQGVFDFIIWLILLVGLIALFVYDLKWMLLPNRIVYPLFYIVVLGVIVDVVLFGSGSDYLLGVIYGFLIGGGLFWLLFQVSKGKWIGGGDVRLGGLLGLSVGGAPEALLMIFIASLLGSLAALPLIVTKKAKTTSRIPFGPFLIIAAIIVKLFGASVIAWYQRQFLLF